MSNEKLTEELKKRGIPFVLEEERLTPEAQEWQEELAIGVWEYLMGIEETDEADEEVDSSTLIFGESGAPNDCRCPVDLSE
jgi:hypothetical protein